MHTLFSHVDVAPGIKSGSYAGTAAGSTTFGTAVPLSEFENVSFLLAGTCAAAAGSVSLALYSATAADNSGSAPIAGANLTFVGTAVPANTEQFHAITLKADQLPEGATYVLPVLTVWGNSMVFLGDVTALRSNPRNAPPANAALLTNTVQVA